MKINKYSEIKNAFYIVNVKKTYILIARTGKSKRIWVEMINNQVANIQSANLIKKEVRHLVFKEPKKGKLAKWKKDLSSETVELVSIFFFFPFLFLFLIFFNFLFI